MVQILVHVRPADRGSEKHFELLDCHSSTSVESIKEQVAELGEKSGLYELPSDQQELVFMGERCEDGKCLRDFGICEEFISQVTGFVINPEKPGKRFVDGVLVS